MVPNGQDVHRVKIQHPRKMGLVHHGSSRLYHAARHHVHAAQTTRPRKLANDELGNGGHVYCPLYLSRYPLASIP